MADGNARPGAMGRALRQPLRSPGAGLENQIVALLKRMRACSKWSFKAVTLKTRP